jgi:parallel beta-helix repeat protein
MRIILTILFLLIASSTQAATYWVRPTGILGGCLPSATAPATDAGYVSTINAGIACLAAGDTLSIRAGTYEESINKPPAGASSSAYTTVTGYLDEVVIVRPLNGNAFNIAAQDNTWKWVAYRKMIFDGTVAGAGPDNGSGPSICCRDYSGAQPATKMATGPNFITFADLEIRNFRSSGMETDANDITIQRVKVHHNATDNFYGPPHGIYMRSARSVIEDSEFYNNGYYGVHMYDSSSGASQNNIVRRVKAYNNGFASVDAGFGSGGGGILIGSGSNNHIESSLAYNNGFPNSGAGLQVDFGCTGCTVTNSTSFANRSSGLQVINGAPTLNNNILTGNSGAGALDITSATGTVTQNYNYCQDGCTGANSIINAGANAVRFADPANRDFRLCVAAGDPHPSCVGVSPAIGFGTDLSGSASSDRDITGTVRAAPWDMGAHESGIGEPPDPDPGPTPDPIKVVEISCDNTVTDSSGQANHGTLTNGATYSASGKYNSACSFDGTNDYVNVADSASLDITHGFTMGAWFFPTSAMTAFKAGLVKNYVFYLYPSSEGACGAGGILTGYDTSGVQANACHATALTANTWTHLEVTYNRTSIIIYRNGVPITSAAGSAFLPATTGAFQIGASEFGENFAGLIDEIRVYNYARTATEVLTDMNTPINAAVPNTVTVRMASTTMKFAGSVLKFGSSTAATPSYILLENGDNWLLEDGDDLLNQQ